MDILENFRASQKKSQSVHYYCIIVRLLLYLLPMCDSVTGLLTTQEVWPLFVYFSLDTGFLSALGLPPNFQRKGPAASSIGDKVWSDLKQELWATVNIGTGPALG